MKIKITLKRIKLKIKFKFKKSKLNPPPLFPLRPFVLKAAPSGNFVEEKVKESKRKRGFSPLLKCLWEKSGTATYAYMSPI